MNNRSNIGQFPDFSGMQLAWRPSVVLISDVTITQALRDRDTSALAALYDSYGNIMYGLALRILRQPQAAEDVVQEVLLTLWNHCNYDATRGSLRSFLLLAVRSRALDLLRKQKSQQRTVQRWESGEVGRARQTPLGDILQNETVHRVQAALDKLPHQQQQVLELSYYEGLTQVQLAERFEVPLGTIKSWFRLAFVKLRRELNDLAG